MQTELTGSADTQPEATLGADQPLRVVGSSGLRLGSRSSLRARVLVRGPQTVGLRFEDHDLWSRGCHSSLTVWLRTVQCLD
eukprot:1493196-Rhodomonas_salina.3